MKGTETMSDYDERTDYNPLEIELTELAKYWLTFIGEMGRLWLGVGSYGGSDGNRFLLAIERIDKIELLLGHERLTEAAAEVEGQIGRDDFWQVFKSTLADTHPLRRFTAEPDLAAIKREFLGFSAYMLSKDFDSKCVDDHFNVLTQGGFESLSQCADNFPTGVSDRLPVDCTYSSALDIVKQHFKDWHTSMRQTDTF